MQKWQERRNTKYDFYKSPTSKMRLIFRQERSFDLSREIHSRKMFA